MLRPERRTPVSNGIHIPTSSTIKTGSSMDGSMFPRILAAAVSGAVQAALDRWLHSDPPTAMAPLIRRALQELAEGMTRTLDGRDHAHPG